jgi:hypothetical protein
MTFIASHVHTQRGMNKGILGEVLGVERHHFKITAANSHRFKPYLV